MLTSINVVGYIKCKRDAGRKLTAIGGTVMARGLEAWQRGRERVSQQEPSS